MQRAIAYGFDLDNTFLRTEKLKWDMARLCHERFPQVKPAVFRECYAEYRIYHYGRVHMDTILGMIAVRAELSVDDTRYLKHEWMRTLPYDKYVFAGARELIQGLDSERMYLMTKSPDYDYQRQKLDACKLPFLRDDVHEWIVESKNPAVFARWIAMMRDRGATHLVYGSDEALEIIWAHEAATTAGLGFDGVHNQYGSIWRSNMDRAQEALGNNYHPARNFHQFAHIIRGLQQTLEGQSQTIEWGRGGRGKEQD